MNIRKGNGGVIFGNNNNGDVNFYLPGMIMDQNGNEILTAILQTLQPNKRQKDSWLLNGDSEKIWIMRGRHKIVFKPEEPQAT
jgi:hypothetical protein